MTFDLGRHYGLARVRLTALLADEPEATWATAVPACPGWDVKAVVSHLVGVIEDAAAGRLSGPPTEDQTALEVARHRDDDPTELLAHWAELAPLFEPVLTERQIWPAAIDVASHEHDVRSALGRPGARDAELVLAAARRLVEGQTFSRPLVVDAGPAGVWRSDGSGAPLGVTTTPFEILRARLGRRSRAQVAALAWSQDPGPLIDELFVFGPRATPLEE